MYGPAALVFYAYGRSWRGGRVRAQQAPKNRAAAWLLDALAVICSLLGRDHART